jgi:hypothetical protein
MAEEVYREAAPIPRAAPTTESTRLLRQIAGIMREVAADENIRMRLR